MAARAQSFCLCRSTSGLAKVAHRLETKTTTTTTTATSVWKEGLSGLRQKMKNLGPFTKTLCPHFKE